MNTLNYFKALGDETRLRLMFLLMHHDLPVNEIVSLMGMGQSRISRHLKILSDCGLLTSRRDGLWIFYSAAKNGRGAEFMKVLGSVLLSDETLEADYEGLKNKLLIGFREKERFFDSRAGEWDDIRHDLFGDQDISAEIVKRLDICKTAVDVGCGNGGLLPYLRQKAERVIGVDKSPRMLEEARNRSSSSVSGIELRLGEVEHLPLRDMEADAAVMSMVLHHLPAPLDGIADLSRVVRGGGRAIIVDLDKHDNEDMRRKYEHRWLGFERQTVSDWLSVSGFALEEFRKLEAMHGLKINIFNAKRNH
jgi:ArsR family transcriptional regulator